MKKDESNFTPTTLPGCARQWLYGAYEPYNFNYQQWFWRGTWMMLEFAQAWETSLGQAPIFTG